MKPPKNKKHCAKQNHPLWKRLQLSPGMSPVSYFCQCGKRTVTWGEWTPRGRELLIDTHPDISLAEDPGMPKVGEFRP